jgi:hypothetical protein
MVLKTRSKLLRLALIPLLAVGTLAMLSTPANAARITNPSFHVTEHYDGKLLALAPGNWHGARDCAVVAQGDAYCFDTEAQFAAFTSVKRAADGSAVSAAVSPSTTGNCNGWAKIWNGTKWTGTGLAFEEYGVLQHLSDYVTTPFNVKSWFTDGQRGYNSMTNCYGAIFNASGKLGTLHTNAESTNDGSWPALSIQLYKGTD